MKNIFLIAIVLLIFNYKSNAQKISPFLFGQNHWIATGDEGTRIGYLNLLWPKVKESGIKCVRIGGNAYNHNFPERQRLTSMIDSIYNIGAEPMLQVPASFTAIQAMELVEFYSRTGNKRVQFWSIGNEPLLRADFTIDQVYDYIIRIATAMKKVNPAIKIFAFDECELREAAYRDLCGGRLDITGLKENGSWLIDGFTFHRYPNGRDFVRDNVAITGPENIFNQALLLKQIIEEADKKHNREGGEELMWALTEVNVTFANPDREISGYGNTSFLGGQFMAEVYGIGMQLGAFSINPWCISETDAVSSDFGYLGLPGEFYPRSSYYHTQMMAQNMTGNFMNTSCNQKNVKIIGSIDKGQICVLVMNKDQNIDYPFDIILNKTGKSKKTLVINADASIDGGISGVIEKQSSMMFVFDTKGSVLKQINYGIKQNLINQGPEKMKIRTKPLISIEKRDFPDETKYVDLGAFYNFALSEEIHGKPGNKIPLKPGIDDYNGVKFDVRGIIQLASNVAFEKSHIQYPEKITGIPINRLADSLCFLHSSAWESKKGTNVVNIVIHYANNQERTITFRNQDDVEDWWFMPGKSIFPANAQLAWEGSNERVKDLGFVLKLYRYTWENPLPEIEITTVDLISSMNDTGYMLYGITCL